MTDNTPAEAGAGAGLETSDLRIEGQATALSSISHGGRSLGTRQTFRTEKVVQPDGRVTAVPVVSGNAVRGILRDASAMVLWDLLGRPEMPMPVFQLLWQGGSLTKAGAGGSIGSRQLLQLKRLVPHIALFGGSGAGQITAGGLRVGKMMPVCTETQHVTPPELHHDHMPSLWDLLQTEQFTRRDDAKRAELAPAIAGMLQAAGAALTDDGDGGQGALMHVDPAPVPADEETTGTGGPQQMRYGTQTIAAGTRLHWWMELHDVTDLERAAFRSALDWWAAHGMAVGGRSATGHGRLQLDMSHWSAPRPTVTAGGELAETDRDLLANHVAAHRDEIVEALEWMT